MRTHCYIFNASAIDIVIYQDVVPSFDILIKIVLQKLMHFDYNNPHSKVYVGSISRILRQPRRAAKGLLPLRREWLRPRCVGRTAVVGEQWDGCCEN